MFIEAIRRAVQIRGSETATIYLGRQRTWRQSQDRTARLAEGLRRFGLQPGCRVGILASNSDRYLEAIHAVWWMGGVIVPMNTRWSPKEHAYSIDHAALDLIFADDQFVESSLEMARNNSRIGKVVYMGDDASTEAAAHFEAIIAANSPAAATPAGHDALAGIFYTGGTTGFPKGVMHSARSLWATALSSAYDLGVPDAPRYLHVPPLFHLGGFTPALVTTALAGTHIFISSFKPELVYEAARHHGVQYTALVSVMLTMLLDHPLFRPEYFAELRVVQYGGGATSDRVRTKANTLLPWAAFQQGFGQSETGGVNTLMSHSIARRLQPDDPRHRSAGRACYGVEVKVVDSEGQLLPSGQVGELCLKTPGAMLGYLDDPEQTAAALVDGWIHTGDAGYVDESGYVYVCDRIKDVIRSGGENVFSAEVENALASHPAIASAVTIAVPDEKWEERVHAMVIVKEGFTVTLEDIQTHCRKLIGGYKIPRSLEVVTSFPLSPQGKILKQQLRAPHWVGRSKLPFRTASVKSMVDGGSLS